MELTKADLSLSEDCDSKNTITLIDSNDPRWNAFFPHNYAQLLYQKKLLVIICTIIVFQVKNTIVLNLMVYLKIIEIQPVALLIMIRAGQV